MKRKNILVSGGAGFIGSHLCRKLVFTGHNIICLDNLLTGSKKNIKDLISKPNFKFIKHDIIEPYFNEQIEEIYNLACPASPFHYQINPIKTIKTNTVGVINMLGLAKKNNAKILQASTSEVYGDPEVHPQKETYYGNVNILGPRSCYDEGKRCAETLFMDYFRAHKLKVKIVRIFNTYGPNMSSNDGRVISNFICQALKDDSLTIFGDGSHTRSFMYVEDLVQGLIKMMNSENKIIGPINFGNPHEINIYNLATLIIKLTNSNSDISFKDLPQDDPKRRKPDISLASKILSWEPNISLNSGLKETIQYFKSK
tara:strand:+ start:1720 stop:2658 length:939 start_codon:yes stop_codon:yes gene_type:complete